MNYKQNQQIKKTTLVSMMKAGKKELSQGSSPNTAWKAAKEQNNLPPTMWDKYITVAMDEGMWYALSS